MSRQFEVRHQSAGSEKTSSTLITTATSDIIKTDSTSVQAGEAHIRVDGVITEVRELFATSSVPAATTAPVSVQEFSEKNSPEDIEGKGKKK